jgi:hypothetical protein
VKRRVPWRKAKAQIEAGVPKKNNLNKKPPLNSVKTDIILITQLIYYKKYLPVI